MNTRVARPACSRLLRQLASLGMLIAATMSIAHPAVYKWVDENGVTQYTEKPPPNKRSVQLPIQSTPAPPAQEARPSTSGQSTWQQKEAEFQRRRVEQEMQRKKQEALEQAAAAERLRACIEARNTLQVLEEQRRVYRLNERGERIYYEGKEREQATEQARRIVERNCDKG